MSEKATLREVLAHADASTLRGQVMEMDANAHVAELEAEVDRLRGALRELLDATTTKARACLNARHALADTQPSARRDRRGEMSETSDAWDTDNQKEVTFRAGYTAGQKDVGAAKKLGADIAWLRFSERREEGGSNPKPAGDK